MKIISIDPGYDRIGVAIIEKSSETDFKEELLFSHCYTTTRGDSITERIFDAAQEIEKLIDTYQPGALAIENVYFTNNQKTAMGVAEAKGAFKYLGMRKGLQIFEYTPLQIKTAIAGDGNASKDQVAWMVSKLIRIDMHAAQKKSGGTSKGLDDEIDAIAVGLTCFACERFLGVGSF